MLREALPGLYKHPVAHTVALPLCIPQRRIELNPPVMVGIVCCIDFDVAALFASSKVFLETFAIALMVCVLVKLPVLRYRVATKALIELGIECEEIVVAGAMHTAALLGFSSFGCFTKLIRLRP